MSKYTGKLVVTGGDNRGDAEVPFGYLYFSDDYRAGYALIDGEWSVVGGGNYWPQPTALHIKVATDYLKEHGAPDPQYQAA